MGNSSNPFASRGTKVFHGVASGAIAVCRFVAYNATYGKLALCPSAARPDGVAPATYADGDAADFHAFGICTVETDGSAAVGDAVKAAADGSGKANKDSSPGFVTGGKLLTLDSTSNIGLVRLYV